ncbi:MAG: hypothetical protein AB8H79_21245 [Myxococcota bacterium]
MIWLLMALGAGAVDPAAVTAAVQSTASARAKRGVDGPMIPTTAYDKAARGDKATGLEKVAGSSAKRAWGVTIIPAPIGRVWAAVNDFSSRTDLTATSFSEIQTGSGCASGRTVFQYLPIGVPMVSDRWWVAKITHTSGVWAASEGRVRELVSIAGDSESGLVTAKAKSMAAKGTPIAFSRGGWMLTDVGGTHTIAEFHVWSDPGGFVPAGIASSFATGGVKDNLKALETLVQQGPSCPIR